MLVILDDQMGGVAVAGLTGRPGGAVGGDGQVVGGVAVVVQQPLDQPHGKGGVGAGQNGDPAVAFAAGMGDGGVQGRVHHHVFQLAMGAGFGQQAALAFERVAGLARCGADEQRKTGMGVVGFGVGVIDPIVHRGTGTQAEGQTAIGAVGTEVARAKGVEGKAAQDGSAAVVGGVHHQQLVGQRAVFGVFRVNQGVVVVQFAQPLDMAFAKQVATFADFLDHLFKGNFFPLALAPLADPFQAVGDAVRTGDLRHHGVAAGTGGGAPGQPLILVTTDAFQGVPDWSGLGQVGVTGQRVIGVANDTQHFFAVVVDPDPHATQGGTAIADGKGGALVRVQDQLAGGAVDAVFGSQRVAVDAVIGLFAGSAFQTIGHFQQRIGITGHKGGSATGCDCALEQAATGKVRLIHGVQLLQVQRQVVVRQAG